MFHCSARSGRRVLLDLLQSLHIARNPDLRDMASELDSETTINGVAYFYEEGTSGENFRKRNKFRLIVMHPDEDKFSVWLSFVAAVTVFAVNNDAVCGFLPHICAVLRFFNPPYAPLGCLFCFVSLYITECVKSRTRDFLTNISPISL